MIISKYHHVVIVFTWLKVLTGGVHFDCDGVDGVDGSEPDLLLPTKDIQTIS